MRVGDPVEDELMRLIALSIEETSDGTLVKADISHWDIENAYPKPLWVGIMIDSHKTVSFRASHSFLMTPYYNPYPGDPPERSRKYSLDTYKGIFPGWKEHITTPFEDCSALLMIPREMLKYGLFTEVAPYFPDAEVGVEPAWIVEEGVAALVAAIEEMVSAEEDEVIITLRLHRDALWNKLFRAAFVYFDKNAYKVLMQGYNREVDIYNLICLHDNLRATCTEYPALLFILSGLVYKQEMDESIIEGIGDCKKIFLAILNYTRRLYNSAESLLDSLPASFWDWAKQTRCDFFPQGEFPIDGHLEWVAIRMAEISSLVNRDIINNLTKEQHLLVNALLLMNQNIALYFLSRQLEFIHLSDLLKKSGVSTDRHIYYNLEKLDKLGIYINGHESDKLANIIIQFKEFEEKERADSTVRRKEQLWEWERVEYQWDLLERRNALEDTWCRALSQPLASPLSIEISGTAFHIESVDSTYKFYSYSLHDFTDRLGYYLSGERRLFVIVLDSRGKDGVRGLVEVNNNNDITMVVLTQDNLYCKDPITPRELTTVLYQLHLSGIKTQHVNVEKIFQFEWVFFDKKGNIGTEYKAKAGRFPDSKRYSRTKLVNDEIADRYGGRD